MKTIGIIGLGNMGLSIARNIASTNKYKIQYHARNKKKVQFFYQKKLSSLISSADIIIIAVKPQNFFELKQELLNYTNKNQIVVSIMAGVNLEIIRKFVNTENLLRVMPNLAIKEKNSLNGYVLDKGFNNKKIKEVEFLLSSWGENIKCQNEKQLNMITTVSGTGIALYFLIADFFINFTLKEFKQKQALQIAKQVMKGASGHFLPSPTLPLDLIKQIASKGGTTEAALKIYQQKNLKDIFLQGLQMAQNRSQELNSILKKQFIYEHKSRKKINKFRK